MNTRQPSRSRIGKFTLSLFFFTVVCFIFLLTGPAEASNPPSGAIGPTGPNVVWHGPLTSDGGRTWSNRVRISDGWNTRTALFPWLATGPTPGSVGVVWYGAANRVNNDDANWQVFYAQSFNADEEVPTFRQVTASDHFIHAINNEGTGSVPPPIEGASLPPKSSLPADGSQVTDFPQDVQVGLLGVLPLNDALDILSVKYSWETSTGGPRRQHHGKAFRVTGHGKIFGKTVSFEINTDDLPSAV